MAFDGVNWIVHDSSQYILPDELYGYEFHNTFCYSLVTYALLDVGLNKLQYVLDISDFVEKVKKDGLFCVQEIYVEPFVKTVSIHFPHTLNMATNNYLCTLLYNLVVSNPNMNVWEARIKIFGSFKIWIDVHKIHEALEYTKHQVKLFKNYRKQEDR
ncbi:unnamed protein product [Lactuca saligna]|uniref:Uncharacterized protein n=1 Tax=Lactuca saligna TaxID=75948 RepID=A0AA35V8T7_LACSI|nr:unnamed protein product [Lactuca saligna]